MSVPTVSAKLLLNVIEHDILPLTEKGVAAGNKIFGAAILRKADFSTLIAETNNELENPLWHGEMHALKRFYELPDNERPATDQLIFVSTSFAIPHDLKILKEVFTLEPGGYNRDNSFWNSFNIVEMAQQDENAKTLSAQIEKITAMYDQLSLQYQEGKDANQIPLN